MKAVVSQPSWPRGQNGSAHEHDRHNTNEIPSRRVIGLPPLDRYLTNYELPATTTD